MVTRVRKRQAYQLAVSAAVLMPLFAAVYYSAFLLRFAGEPDPHARHLYATTLFWLISVKWCVFLWFRLHQGWTRFVGFDDLLVIVKAVTCESAGRHARGYDVADGNYHSSQRASH